MAGLTVRGGRGLLNLPSAGSLATANQIQPYSSEVRERNINLAAMKRGKGGRSSFSGDVVTVFGGSGFLARGVNNRLGKNGSQIIFPYRGDHYQMMRLKVVGDLGQVLFCPFELRDEDSIRRAVARSNIVINLIGRGIETSNFSFKDVNVTGPATIARICREMGVKRLVHISSINARAEPNRAFLREGSSWLRTKYEGEQAVLNEFPDATIFRCSDVYGQGDQFLSRLNYIVKSSRSEVPLFLKGQYTVKQPVFLSDVASGIMNSLHDPNAVGQIYEAVGPERFTLHSLAKFIFELARLEDLKITEMMLTPSLFFKAYITGKTPFGGINLGYQTGIETLDQLSISDESEGYPNLTDLGVKLSTVAEKMPFLARANDFQGYQTITELHQLPKTVPPKPLTLLEEKDLMAEKMSGMRGAVLNMM